MLQERADHREDAGVCVGRHRSGSCGNRVSEWQGRWYSLSAGLFSTGWF